MDEGSIMDCTVCLESLLEGSSAATQCGHIFHHTCLVVWLKAKSSCPKCRKPVYINQLRQIFLEGRDDAPRTKQTSKSSRERKVQSLEKNYIKILRDELKEMRSTKNKYYAEIKSLLKTQDKANDKIARLTKEVITLRKEAKEHKQNCSSEVSDGYNLESDPVVDRLVDLLGDSFDQNKSFYIPSALL